MNTHRLFNALAVLALAPLMDACHGHGPGADHSHAAATDASTQTATEGSPEVSYVPAYPQDVSSDELSEDDVEQQRGTTHSHGGEEHTHDDGTDHSPDESHDEGGHDH